MQRASSRRAEADCDASNAPRRRRRWAALWLASGVAMGAILAWRAAAGSSERLLAQARQALEAGDYRQAEALSSKLLSRQPELAGALLVAGAAVAKQDRWQDALAFYARIPDRGDLDYAEGCFAAGEILLEHHRASEAERKFRETLAVDRGRLLAHNRLGYLLGVEGRRWESLPHLFALLRGGEFSSEVLFLIGDRAATIEQLEELRKFRQAAPDDVAPLIGYAKIALRNNQTAEAKRLARQVLAAAPELIEAHVVLAQALLNEAEDDELAERLAALPDAADQHPDIWRIRGSWAARRAQPRAAARCFWEALRLDPNMAAANLQLAQLLAELQPSPIVERLRERAVLLQRLANAVGALYDNRQDLPRIRLVSELMEPLGRIWEAWGWRRMALGVDPQLPWAREGTLRLQAGLHKDLPQTSEAADPSRQVDLSSFPVPRWETARRQAIASVASSWRPRFKDLALQSGIDFTYVSGSHPKAPGRRIQQVMAGGIAVLDFEGDGWPDVYLSQGCPWPTGAEQTKHLDRLYRNLGDGRFQDVTAFCGIIDGNFGQGVAVGDLDGDGFPDLYLANIGGNRLFVNRGDGTFDETTRQAGLSGDKWTTSCLLVDLNGDAHPDIYDVNYVQGPDIYERVCRDENGRDRTCNPTEFSSQPDRFFVSLGDGRFEEATEAAGLSAPEGNGLGIVAADFDDSGRLSLFIANDQDANFHFVNRTSRPGDAPRFLERGVLSGLAYDGEGRSQACMGVASGDADNDGRLDLFVTNFYRDSNTLYLQNGGESFVDATAQAGLRAPSYDMLGFGVQFVDGELDGWRDLVLTNGHIDDDADPRTPCEMPPQYFRNLGDARFAELPAREVGEFFEGAYFGRSMARLDWNRDGREDVLIMHLDSPLALLTNQTEPSGHYLAIQLRGVASSRDAIGATATIVAGGRVRRQWLTAGDGYQASNERKLIFGLGTETRVEKLQVRWPSGTTQEFADLAADQEWIVVEGSPRITPLAPVR